MKKFLVLTLTVLVTCFPAFAKKADKALNHIIKDSNISESSISISFIDINNSKTVIGINDKMLMHPASVQKLLTIIPYSEILGENYNFSTKLYSRGNDSYLIKLGADPYLSGKDLKNLISQVKKDSVKKIYIDDSIIEKKDWGEGWQWDDDLNTYTTRFNSYNLDKNITKITIMPASNKKDTIIINPVKSPIVFLNHVTVGDKNDVKVSRENTSNNIITLDGSVKTPQTLTIPNNNLKLYFNTQLTNVLADYNIYLKEPFKFSPKSNSDVFITEIQHPLSTAIDDILKNSDNMVIETLGKVAAEKYTNKTGTDVESIKLFEDYCDKIGIDSSGIRLVDSSGVSKNNLSDANFISGYLVKNKDAKVLNHMAHPGEGTLSNRMIILKDNLRAKTGTLSDISSIAGYLETKRGNEYAFCIIINDPKTKSADKKALEDKIIREVYLKM